MYKLLQEVQRQQQLQQLDQGADKALATAQNFQGKHDFGNYPVQVLGSFNSGMGGDIHGHPSESDYYGVFPSIHSGSWSALIHEAVQASIADKGQEGWSGMGFQKTEQLTVKHFVTTNDNGKHAAVWVIAALRFTNEENNKALTEVPHASFKSSSGGPSHKEFLQSRIIPKLWRVAFKFKYLQLVEPGLDKLFSCVKLVLLNSLNASYLVASRGDNTLNYQEIDDSLWKIGENHGNLTCGLQPVKIDIIGSPKMQAEEFLAGDKDVIENQNQPTRRPQTWNTSLSAAVERLGDRLREGMQKSGHRRGLQGPSNSVSQGSNNEEQPFVEKSQFSGHTVSNNSVDVPKFTWKLSDLQRIAVGTEELLSGNTIPLCATDKSFDGSTAQIFQNKTVAPISCMALVTIR
ncbi:hypothetical protein MUK42_15545 [Musa troglodytarum]|uniref:Uncharacterized protein n=1 Tax=Musa troglodytarum TaxID=320322 RepID=A0A9E7FC95_9LILI|nr:hypothetical protein MUK42_15545 [Musa troglodytarum]